MKITAEQVAYVARLAKLTVSEEEKVKLTLQLEQILNYVEQLNELDTSKVEPTSHAILLENVFREDQETPSLPPELALKNAPERENGFFKVPKVIE
ncbi:MAG: Asp-tRNA(Asn)/Glu-tRNA(Gln) amidotransferase subunit GatC [Nitrospirae bacterium]|nr:Asp-tRNA(Asn)/Glu-tRNA(Gln) amidotransferase subunit GatC [Nitrospirota bacterium]MBI3594754.1 Asp-tRNA(Asn)/Glu-tRNA(Gln) amidotransferase subunit GatC [Nitrospirota bacterium]